MFSILETLAARCVEAPSRPALADNSNRVLTREQLVQKIQTFARGFEAAGLKPGDKVLFAARPDVETLMIMIGIVVAGGVLIPMGSAVGPELFASRMKLLSPRWVVSESVLFAVSANRWIARLLAWCGITLPNFTEVKQARFVRVGRKWPGVPTSQSSTEIEQLGERSTDETPSARKADEPMMIVFTSGTTGSPKAVVHSWGSMQGVLEAVGSVLDIGVDDVVYAREIHLILPALFAGTFVVVPRSARFSIKRVLRDIRRHRVTHYFGVTSELQQLSVHLHSRKQKLPNILREIWIGAAPVHAAFLQRLQTVLADTTKVWCVYGMTEILPIARISLTEKVQFQGQGDLLGECVKGVNATISPDGELLLSGRNLCAGYLGEPPLTELATGDLARLEKGRIVLLGRRKDMIIRGRFNIYPELYESTIERVEGVHRCAMVGLFDDNKSDERIVLFVEPSPDTEASTLEKKLWRDLRIGPFAIDPTALPDNIILMTLPVTGRSNKIDKQSLRVTSRRIILCESQ